MDILVILVWLFFGLFSWSGLWTAFFWMVTGVGIYELAKCLFGKSSKNKNQKGGQEISKIESYEVAKTKKRFQELKVFENEFQRLREKGLVNEDVQGVVNTYLIRERQELISPGKHAPARNSVPASDTVPQLKPKSTPISIPKPKQENLPQPQTIHGEKEKPAEEKPQVVSQQPKIAKVNKSPAQHLLNIQKTLRGKKSQLPREDKKESIQRKEEPKEKRIEKKKTAPAIVSSAPINEKPIEEKSTRAPKLKSKENPKIKIREEPSGSWKERLFTAQNIRILHGLGISIIFMSAVAYVRMELWDSAKEAAKFSWLCVGTGVSFLIGFLLRKFVKSLRITSMGFLVLGNVTLLLNAYAAILFELWPKGEGVWLWFWFIPMFGLLQYVQAKFFKEKISPEHTAVCSGEIF